jgi:hypothetical protein
MGIKPEKLDPVNRGGTDFGAGVVHRNATDNLVSAEAALASLCQTNWFPLYAQVWDVTRN